MRLHVLSDLHQEFGEIDVPSVDCDVVVLAGDVSTQLNGLQWIKHRFGDKPVIYICGNHEFYGGKFPRIIEKLREETRGTNIHFLEDDHVTIDGVHFFGSTLWTDMALLGDWRMGAVVAGDAMNDYKRVRNSERMFKKLTAQDTRMAHHRSVIAMKEWMAGKDAQRSVVVTHHAPSILSLPDYRRSQNISCAYASNLDELVKELQPVLWIHGHIHHSSDYHIGSTRILANPRGYPEGGNGKFQPGLVVEVG